MRIFDWEFLPHFLAVARAGSLRAAAQLIGANYGTVNRSIQALEASYGVRLFHRSRRGFSLTEFGEALMPMAEEAEQKIIAARKRVEEKCLGEMAEIFGGRIVWGEDLMRLDLHPGEIFDTG